MIGIVIFVIYTSVKVCVFAGGLRQIRVADDEICEMIENPSYSKCRLMFKAIYEFNENFVKLANKVQRQREQTDPKKWFKHAGKIFVNYKPKFTTIKIDEEKLINCLHWNARNINHLKYLIQQTKTLKASLFKTSKGNYKCYQLQSQEYYYEESEKIEMQQNYEPLYNAENYGNTEYYKQENYYDKAEFNGNASNMEIKISEMSDLTLK